MVKLLVADARDGMGEGNSIAARLSVDVMLPLSWFWLVLPVFRIQRRSVGQRFLA